MKDKEDSPASAASDFAAIALRNWGSWRPSRFVDFLATAGQHLTSGSAAYPAHRIWRLALPEFSAFYPDSRS